MLALDKMLEAQRYVVAIVPETLSIQGIGKRSCYIILRYLEDNPFDDTENPVVVAL